MTDHDRAIDLAAISLDFPLTPRESSDLEGHLRHCRSCRQVAAALRADKSILSRLPEADASLRVREAVIGEALKSRPEVGRGWLPLAAALAVVVVLVGGGLSGALRAPPFAEPQGSKSLSTLAWNRVTQPAIDGGPGSAEISATARGLGRLVAVGSDRAGAAAWVSADGRTWRRSEPIAGSRFARMLAVTAGGPGLVAVGQEVGRSGGTRSVVWTSANGSSWTRVPDSTAFDRSAMRAVAAGGPGVIAVGLRTSPEGAAVWTSPDGVAWTRLPDAKVFEASRMTGIAVAGPVLSAVGYDAGDAVVWTSETGSTWRRVEGGAAGGSFEGARMLAVTWSGSGLIAVGLAAGSDGSTNGAAWTSSDGARWVRVGGDSVFAGATLTAVTASGTRSVVAGQDAAGAGIWTSDDDATWTRVSGRPDFLGAEIRGVILVDSGAIAVGTGSGRGALWSADRTN